MDGNDTEKTIRHDSGFSKAYELVATACYAAIDSMNNKKDVVKNVLKSESTLEDFDSMISDILHLRSIMLNNLSARADDMYRDFKFVLDNSSLGYGNSLYVGAGMRDVSDEDIKRTGMNIRSHFFDDTLECCRKFDLSKCQLDTYPFHINRWTFTDGFHAIVISIPRSETFPKEIQDIDIIYRMYVSVSAPARRETSTYLCDSVNPYEIKNAVVEFCKEIDKKPFHEVVSKYEDRTVYRDYDRKRRMSTISRLFEGEFDHRYFR